MRKYSRTTFDLSANFTKIEAMVQELTRHRQKNYLQNLWIKLRLHLISFGPRRSFGHYPRCHWRGRYTFCFWRDLRVIFKMKFVGRDWRERTDRFLSFFLQPKYLNFIYLNKPCSVLINVCECNERVMFCYDEHAMLPNIGEKS